MDDRDAKDIYNRLQQLEQHDTENMHLVAKQVSVVKSTFNTLESSISNLTQQQISLEERFDQLTEKFQELSEMKAELRVIHIKADIVEIVVFMLSKLQNLYFQLSEEHTILVALRQHKLHPLILSDKDLINIYQNMIGMSQSHQFLNDPHLLSQTVKVDYVQIERKFLVRLTIPLTETEEYTLNKVFLLPIKESGTQYSLLDLDSNYVLNNTKNGHYLEFTQQEFESSCRSYTGQEFVRIYICEQSRPKLITKESRNCLVHLLAESDSNVPICTHRFLPKVTNYITRLERKNSWLFNLQEPSQLTIHCNRKNQKLEIQGVGILTLTEPCSFLLDSIEIPYQRNYEYTIPVHQPDTEKFPHLKIDNALLETLKSDNDSKRSNYTPPQLKIHGEYNKALRLSSKALEDIQRELSLTELERKAQKQNVHSYLNTSITLSVIALLLVTTMIKICLRRIKRGRSVLSTNQVDPEGTEIRAPVALPSPKIETRKVVEIPAPPPMPPSLPQCRQAPRINERQETLHRPAGVLVKSLTQGQFQAGGAESNRGRGSVRVEKPVRVKL